MTFSFKKKSSTKRKTYEPEIHHSLKLLVLLATLAMLATLAFPTVIATPINPANNSFTTANITFSWKATGDDAGYLSNVSVIGYGYIGTDIPSSNNSIATVNIIGAPLGPAQWHVESWNSTSGDYVISADYDFTVKTSTISANWTASANSGSRGDSATYSIREQADSRPAYSDGTSHFESAHAGFFTGVFTIPIPPTPGAGGITKHGGDVSILGMSDVGYFGLLACIVIMFIFLRRKNKKDDKETKEASNE